LAEPEPTDEDEEADIKPKKSQKLFEDADDWSDGDDVTGGAVDDEADDEEDLDDIPEDEFGGDSDSDESIGTKSRNILQREKAVEQMTEKQLRLNIQNQMKEKDEQGLIEEGSDLKSVKTRIASTLETIINFKTMGKGKKKKQVREDLLKDLELYYEYNSFLMRELYDIFTPKQILDYLDASETPRPLTIRTNTLRTRRKDLAQSLINRGVNLDPLGPWTKVGLVVYQSQVPIGATPEYLAGHYAIQGASSMLPVIALAPKEKERILDLCAAPGMKTTYIAQLMKDTGTLVANDANFDRCNAIVGNLHRCGVSNATVCNMDGRKITENFTDFDRVLVDAPCSGTGIVAKDSSVKTSKDEINIQRCFTMQRQLLLAAIDACKHNSLTGGYIVYSTCSVLVEENEAVVQYAMEKRNVQIVDSGLSVGENAFTRIKHYRFHKDMKLAKRYYPHTHNMDGFFVCKLKKLSDGLKVDPNDVNKDDADD
jgi:ribosomal RNA methyltransferase Nop2